MSQTSYSFPHTRAKGIVGKKGTFSFFDVKQKNVRRRRGGIFTIEMDNGISRSVLYSGGTHTVPLNPFFVHIYFIRFFWAGKFRLKFKDFFFQKKFLDKK